MVGVFWLALAMFVGLALFSYDPGDPSFNTAGADSKVLNYCGYFGAFLSDLLYQLLGVSAWLIVLGFVRRAIFGFAGKDLTFNKWHLIWGGMLFITVSSLVSLHLPDVYIFQQKIPVGGVLGMLVTAGLVKAFNFYGVCVILWSVATMLMVFYTERSIGELAQMPLDGVRKLYAAVVTLFNNKYIVRYSLKFRRFFSFRRSTIPIENSPARSSVRRFLFLKKSDEMGSGSQSEREEFDGEEEDLDPNEFDLVNDEKIENQLSLKPRFQFSEKKRKVKLKTKVKRHVAQWELPKLSLIDDPPATRHVVDEREIKRKAALLVDKLSQFNVGGDVVGIKPGPAVTMFEFKPNADVKISKITDLADDLCLALSSESVRIIAPIPGRDVVGIETSNTHQETVFLKDILAEPMFWDDGIKIPIPLGRQANGEPKVVDLRKMPHMMVAGTTGSGKSVFVVSCIISLIFKHSPKTLRLILVDPKQVDLAIFSDIPHLLMPPIREPKKAVVALRWAIKEMEKRYRSMAKFGARGIEGFNEKVEEFDKDELAEHERINEELNESNILQESYYFTPQPYIVIVVEEFGDLMAVDKQNVENGVVRLAQMARACGMHLILAMQSPRKDVVTGLIKTNIPGRASFKVASKLDSRVILDESGAERLLARGDMLFLAPGVSKPARHHGAWLTERDISNIIKFWAAQGEPAYDDLALKALDGTGGGFDLSEGTVEAFEEDEYDDRYDEILAWASTQKSVSASLIQRKFRLGYPRAARIVEVMENEGVIGPAVGSKPRQVLVSELK